MEAACRTYYIFILATLSQNWNIAERQIKGVGYFCIIYIITTQFIQVFVMRSDCMGLINQIFLCAKKWVCFSEYICCNAHYVTVLVTN